MRKPPGTCSEAFPVFIREIILSLRTPGPLNGRLVYRLTMFCLSSSAGSVGTLKLPLKHRVPLLAGESFSFFLMFRRAVVFAFFCCCGRFFVPCTSMLSSSISAVLQYRKHRTQYSKASTCPSDRGNASNQTELTRASTCRRASTQHAEFSKRTKKSKSVRPRRISYCSIFTQRWCDARRICL